MSMQLDFRLTLMSDYHVGAGHGEGPLVDSALLRDSGGIPTLRGTMLVGLLRDALYELLQTESLVHHRKCEQSGKAEPSYCGQWEDVEAPCPICRLFGNPKSPKRWHISSARPEGLEIPLATKRERSLGGSVVARASINPRTRRAGEHKLFSHELGSQQFIFHFSALCECDDDDVLPEAALLVAAARFLRNFGGNRRRGWGECRLHLDGDCRLQNVDFGLAGANPDSTVEESLLDCFKRYWIDGKPLPSLTIDSKPQTVALVSEEEQLSQAPVRFLVIARTDEPLICARRAEAGNQFETLPFIPSSTLLGAFAARVANRWNLNSNTSVYQNFVRLFRRGFVRFPFLYPAYFDEEVKWRLYPAIPAPLDLLTCKVYTGFVQEGEIERHGIFPGTTDNLSACPKCKEKGKENKAEIDVPLESLSGFVALRSSPKHFSARRHSEMHPRINPQTKRVGDEGLFGYTVLSEGQYFVGEMVFRNEQAFQTFVQLTGLPAEGDSFTLRLGKAFRRGYGLTTLLLQRLDADAHELWIGQSIEDRVQAEQDIEVVMTLLTDTILFDSFGCSTVDSVTNVLSAHFGETVEILVEPSFVKTRQISPFNTHLGLPRKQETAITAGSSFSCLFMGLEPEKLHDCLKTLERQGIGERRWEDFGRIAFNHPVYEECQSINNDDTYIELPESIQLGSEEGVETHFAGLENRFQDRWEKDLKYILSAKASHRTPWEAVARLLRRNLMRTIDDIKAEIEDIGKGDNVLDSVPEGREKENFFKTKGESLKKQLIAALVKLAEHSYIESAPDSEKSRLRQIGIMMLAEHIASIAKGASE